MKMMWYELFFWVNMELFTGLRLLLKYNWGINWWNIVYGNFYLCDWLQSRECEGILIIVSIGDCLINKVISEPLYIYAVLSIYIFLPAYLWDRSLSTFSTTQNTHFYLYAIIIWSGHVTGEGSADVCAILVAHSMYKHTKCSPGRTIFIYLQKP